jgi:drug/metabolite transporter (DMT)-like permease
MCGFGAIQAIGKPYIPDRPWFWGAAFCAAAAFNWKRGTTLNSRSRSKRKQSPMMQRLFYKAGNRFMSMPMETFSIILLLAGFAIALQPVFSISR